MPRIIVSLCLTLLCVQGLVVFSSAFVVLMHMPIASHCSFQGVSNGLSGRMSRTGIHEASSSVHIVDGIECREVTIDIPAVGPVTILEATAKSQAELVDMALALDENELTVPNQLQAGDPYGAVLWPAAFTISNYLLTQCGSLKGRTILELGTGTGLVSLVASLGGAAKVIATDYEPIPLRLLEYAHANLNHGVTPIDTGTCLASRPWF
jgi:Lysine methyltransferase